MLYRIDGQTVYVDTIYHQLQDYENTFVDELDDRAPYEESRGIKSYLIRGAVRENNITYPDENGVWEIEYQRDV